MDMVASIEHLHLWSWSGKANGPKAPGQELSVAVKTPAGDGVLSVAVLLSLAALLELQAGSRCHSDDLVGSLNAAITEARNKLDSAWADGAKLALTIRSLTRTPRFKGACHAPKAQQMELCESGATSNGYPVFYKNYVCSQLRDMLRHDKLVTYDMVDPVALAISAEAFTSPASGTLLADLSNRAPIQCRIETQAAWSHRQDPKVQWDATVAPLDLMVMPNYDRQDPIVPRLPFHEVFKAFCGHRVSDKAGTVTRLGWTSWLRDWGPPPVLAPEASMPARAQQARLAEELAIAQTLCIPSLASEARIDAALVAHSAAQAQARIDALAPLAQAEELAAITLTQQRLQAADLTGPRADLAESSTAQIREQESEYIRAQLEQEKQAMQMLELQLLRRKTAAMRAQLQLPAAAPTSAPVQLPAPALAPNQPELPAADHAYEPLDHESQLLS
jgi:hypothetical protein